jgi:hypothetical protein
MQVMTPDLAELLVQLPSFEAEALRDAVQGDIDAGVGTAFALLCEGPEDVRSMRARATSPRWSNSLWLSSP